MYLCAAVCAFFLQDVYQDYFTVVMSSENYNTGSTDLSYYKKNNLGAVQSLNARANDAGLLGEYQRQGMVAPTALEDRVRYAQASWQEIADKFSQGALDYKLYDKLNWYDSNDILSPYC